MSEKYRPAMSCKIIGVRVPELRSLFNSMDPPPFGNRDLDPSAEELIVSSGKELGRDVRPIEVFLYNWWPIRAEARLCDRLAEMPVRFQHASDESSDAWRDDSVSGMKLLTYLECSSRPHRSNGFFKLIGSRFTRKSCSGGICAASPAARNRCASA